MPPGRTCRGLCHMGAVVARQDYLPFGEEIPAGYAGRSSSLLFGASDGVEQKFTGQVRDSETVWTFLLRGIMDRHWEDLSHLILQTQVRMQRIRSRGTRMHM